MLQWGVRKIWYNNNNSAVWQRRLEKRNSYIALLCAQGWELRRPTSNKCCGKKKRKPGAGGKIDGEIIQDDVQLSLNIKAGLWKSNLSSCNSEVVLFLCRNQASNSTRSTNVNIPHKMTRIQNYVKTILRRAYASFRFLFQGPQAPMFIVK